MQKLFDSLNDACQINAKNIEFWDYFDLYNITYDIVVNYIGNKLPDHVFECSGDCPIFCSEDTYSKEAYHRDYKIANNMIRRYYKYFYNSEDVNGSVRCTGGHYPIMEKLVGHFVWGMPPKETGFGEPYVPPVNIFEKHVEYYITREQKMSAKLSRFAAYSLFNSHFVRMDKDDFYWKRFIEYNRRLVDSDLNSDMQLFILAYFMNPAADFIELQNIVQSLMRIFARNKNRELEKRFSGVVYNVCASNYDFAEIRNAAKNAIFFEKGRPLTNSKEPPANFYNSQLLYAMNYAMSDIIDTIKRHYAPDESYDDDFAKGTKRKRLKKQDILTIVQNEFNTARKNLNEQNLCPEDMFCKESVKQLKTTINSNERQFIKYYSKRRLSK